MISIAVTAVLLVGGYFYTKDIPPIDDSDLALPDLRVTAKSNGYVTLVAIDFSGLDASPDLRKELFEDPHTWTPTLVRNVTKNSMGAIAAIAKSLEAQEFSPVSPADLANNNAAVLSAERVLLANFEYRLNEGQIDGAINAAWLMEQYTHRLLEGANSIVHYIVANRGRAFMFEGLHRLISHPELTAEQAAKVRTVLPNPGALDRPLEQALKGEYQFIKETAFGEAAATSKGAAFIMKKNATTKLVADYFRGYLSNIPVVAKERDMSFVGAFQRDPGPVAAVLSGNPIGSVMASVATPNLNGLLDEHSWRKTQRRLLELGLALREYEFKHSAFPDSLDALIPEYLGASLSDPFSGDPFVYDKIKRSVHSVGMNLSDDSGDAGDIVFSFIEDPATAG